MARERANGIFLDDYLGGRFYERFIDGSECEIGRVIGCEPPHLIVHLQIAGLGYRDGGGSPLRRRRKRHPRLSRTSRV